MSVGGLIAAKRARGVAGRGAWQANEAAGEDLPPDPPMNSAGLVRLSW
jgi:hypothetical protein